MDAAVMGAVAFSAAGVALLALAGASLALRSAARARRSIAELVRDGGLTYFVDAAVREQLRRGLSRVGLVRYDALADMGGRMSFSLALLDEDADGVVVSAINGRTESRCYGKAVAGGAAEHELSPEEKEAIAQAMAARPGPPGPPGRPG